jgi:hypothetical protein
MLRVGENEVPQAAPPRLGLEVLHHGRMDVRAVGSVHLLRPDRLGGVDVLVHEREQALAEVLGAVGQLEVHCADLLTLDLGHECDDRRTSGRSWTSAVAHRIAGHGGTPTAAAPPHE